MGMYTGLRFKGIVKEEFRKGFEIIALNGDWESHNNPRLKQFGEVDRASFIPCGSLAYMPDEWEEGEYPDEVATDGFNRTYDEDTGYWAFQCSLKNYSNTIEMFFKLLPYFIESIEHCEYFYEEFDWSWKYELIDGEVRKTSSEFIQYNDYYDY